MELHRRTDAYAVTSIVAGVAETTDAEPDERESIVLVEVVVIDGTAAGLALRFGLTAETAGRIATAIDQAGETARRENDERRA